MMIIILSRFMEHYNAGRYLEALKEFTVLLEKNKNDVNIINKLMKYVCLIYGNTSISYTSEFIEWIKQAATEGNSFAQNNLGFMYDYGIGISKNHNEAFKFYKLSVTQENVAAYVNLATMYQHGECINANMNQAFKLCKVSAEKGFSYAQNGLGNLYYSIEQYTSAVEWYKLSVNQNNNLGQKNLAEMYEGGLGVEVNHIQAINLYKLSASQGNQSAKSKFKLLFKKIKDNSTIFEDMCEKYFEYDKLKGKIKEQDEELTEYRACTCGTEDEIVLSVTI